MMKKKKKRYVKDKIVAAARRDAEIKEFGKLISFRPAKIFKSKRDYKRNRRIEIDED